MTLTIRRLGMATPLLVGVLVAADWATAQQPAVGDAAATVEVAVPAAAGAPAVVADADNDTDGQRVTSNGDIIYDSETAANAEQTAEAQVDPATPAPVVAAVGDAAAEAAERGERDPANVQVGLQFGQPTNRGLAIGAIDQTSYFYDNGLRQGDVVVSYNGRPIRTQADFGRWVTYQAGQRVPVIVFRDGREETVYVTYRVDAPPTAVRPGQRPAAYLGVSFDPRVQDAAVVLAVHPGSPAEQSGLRPGDEIVALNGRAISNFYEVIGLVAAANPGSRLDIEYVRRARTAVVLGSRETGVSRSASYAPAPAVEVQRVPAAVTVAPPATIVAPIPNPAPTNRDRALLPRRRN